ncbi:MAG: hypothetical protein HRT43_03675, partial [Campylobacteraceae bacterium]|nr:hypothetical protein [Campylobacteraceae bacterium]
MYQMKHKLSWILGMLMLLISIPVYANIPELVEIPDGLSSSQNEKFTHSKSLLDKRWDVIFTKVNSHNQKCQNVASNTQLASTCRKKMGDLQSELALYIKDVEKFNKDIESIIKNTKPLIVLKEQEDYEKRSNEWLLKQQDLIRKAVASEKKRDKEMLTAIKKDKVPKFTQKKLNDLKPGDVILLKKGEGTFSQTIPYGDVLLRWMREKSLKPKTYGISHSVVYLKTVNGKRLYLDHQLDDKFARVIDEDLFLERYEKRLSFIARPKALVNGKKLWEAAKSS